MPKPLPSPTEAKDKYLRNAGNATQSYQEGIQRVTENPMEKAAAREQHWANKIAEAAREKRYSKGLRKVSMEDWKTAAMGKGAANYPGGIAAAAPKMEAFFTKLFPLQAELQKKVHAMPSDTPDQTKARMNANFDGMRAMKGKVT